MSPREMQIRFQLVLEDRGLRVPVSDDLFRYLTGAQDALVREAVSRVEQDLEHYDLLRPLVVRDHEEETVYDGEALTGHHVDRAPLPADYRHLLYARANTRFGPQMTTAVTDGKRVVGGTYTARRVPLRMVQKDDVNRLLLDPFSTSSHDDPISELTRDGLKVYAKDFVTVSVVMTYLREPTPITLEQPTLLPDFVHEELVHRALLLYVGERQPTSQQSAE